MRPGENIDLAVGSFVCPDTRCPVLNVSTGPLRPCGVIQLRYSPASTSSPEPRGKHIIRAPLTQSQLISRPAHTQADLIYCHEWIIMEPELSVNTRDRREIEFCRTTGNRKLLRNRTDSPPHTQTHTHKHCPCTVPQIRENRVFHNDVVRCCYGEPETVFFSRSA